MVSPNNFVVSGILEIYLNFNVAEVELQRQESIPKKEMQEQHKFELPQDDKEEVKLAQKISNKKEEKDKERKNFRIRKACISKIVNTEKGRSL